jgi:phage gpG-like protein
MVLSIMTIKTNIGQVTQALAEKIKVLQDVDYLLRPVAFGLIDKMTQRIHNEGRGSDGGEIGQYSNTYLQQRQRKPYNRTGDRKIIVSLTRQLENDWSVIAVDKGYGIGFKNPFNLQKLRWVEEGKGKKIGDLTQDEEKYVVDYLNELVSEALQ